MPFNKRFLEQITAQKWQRIDDWHFTDDANHLAYFELESCLLTLFIEDVLVYAGPIPGKRSSVELRPACARRHCRTTRVAPSSCRRTRLLNALRKMPQRH
jgi:hypothetical protein